MSWMFWMFSSAGRAFAWRAKGQRFEPVNIHHYGRFPEWPNGADCKSVVVRLRWFESIISHHIFLYILGVLFCPSFCFCMVLGYFLCIVGDFVFLIGLFVVFDLVHWLLAHFSFFLVLIFVMRLKSFLCLVCFWSQRYFVDFYF